MGRIFNKAYNLTAERLPGGVAGRIDRMRPSFATPFGGPMNGQVERRQIVRDLAAAVEFHRVVETGTYRGTTTEFLASVFGTLVDTVEAHGRYYEYALRRLAAWPNVTLSLSDSRSFLRDLAARPEASDETVFVYLDAHWEDDLPLGDELDIIAAAWPRAVVMVDDFEVAGDPAYRFDDYGPGKRLTADYLPESVRAWRRFYPSAPASEETGFKRGCCVLVSPALEVKVPSLRPA